MKTSFLIRNVGVLVLVFSIVFALIQKLDEIGAETAKREGSAREKKIIARDEGDFLAGGGEDAPGALSERAQRYAGVVAAMLGVLQQNPLDASHLRARYGQAHLGIRNDDAYCLRSDAFKLAHPETVLAQLNFFTEFDRRRLVRDILRRLGNDTRPHVQLSMRRELFNARLYTFALNTSVFFTHESKFLGFHRLNEQAVCLFQLLNHVPGKQSVTLKDLVVDNYLHYRERHAANEECLRSINHQPETYRLYNAQECRDFFVRIDSAAHKELLRRDGPQFIAKFGRDVHKGKGVNVLFYGDEVNLKSQYEYGKLCGRLHQIMIVQRYVANPVLFEGYKIELRIYFLIASTDPLIVFSQNRAHIKKCALPYDRFSLDKPVHVCNTAVGREVRAARRRDAEERGRADGEVPEFIIDWELEYLEQYLERQGRIAPGARWLEETLYPQIHRALIHTVRAGQYQFYNDSRFFELFAADFLLDEELNLVLMENNFNAEILNVSEARVQRHVKMFADLFEIQLLYLRQRFARLSAFAERHVARLLLQGDAEPPDEDAFAEEFRNLNRNFLPNNAERRVSPNNSFVKIYDENLPEDQRSFGLLPLACLETPAD